MKRGNKNIEHLRHLSTQIDKAFDQRAFRALCNKLGYTFVDIPNSEKYTQAISLVSTMMLSNRLDQLMAECIKRRPEFQWEGSQFGSGIISRLKTKFDRRRKKDSLKHNVSQQGGESPSFVDPFFSDWPLAFENELRQCWEYRVTQLLWRKFPKSIAQQITQLSNQATQIGLLPQTSQLKFEQEALIDQIADENQASPLLSYRALFNYHSVRCWYGRIRSLAAPLILVAGIVIATMLLFVIVTVFGILVGVSSDRISGSTPNIIYTGNQPGRYYVKIQDLASDADQYMFTISQSASSIITPDFSQTNVWPLGNEHHRVMTRITYDKPHIYRLSVRQNETVSIFLNPLSIDNDIEFMLLDSQMIVCDQTTLSVSEVSEVDSSLKCQVTVDGTYYLQVQMPYEEFVVDIFSAPSRYAFDVYHFQDYLGHEPNNSAQKSIEITSNSSILAKINSSGQDWYRFSTNVENPLKIGVFGLSDSDLSSLSLYQETERGLELIAHTTRGSTSDVEITESLLTTSIGRAHLLSAVLSYWGVHISANTLIQSDWEFYIIIAAEILLPIIIIISMRLVSKTTPRYYQGSKVVQTMITILAELKGNDILQSDYHRAKLRRLIRLVSDDIREIYKANRFPLMSAPPPAMGNQLSKIADQIYQMNMQVSAPNPDTLTRLRQRFGESLGVFLKSEYQAFQFEADFKPIPIPWHKRLAYALQRRWGLKALAVISVLILTWLTIDFWMPYLWEILDWIWLGVRYLILTICTYGIYNRWGQKASGATSTSGWQSSVRLITFFFIPLLAFDALLQTGIVDSIIKIVSSLKIF